MIEFKKILLTKFGGIEIVYTDSPEADNAPIDYKIKSIAAPHPDLVNIFSNMRGFVMRVFNWADWRELFTAAKIYDKIRVYGIEYAAGNSVILFWEFLADNGTLTKLVTPRIKLESDVFGFEQELAQLSQKMRDETDSYIKGKRAQLVLFGQKDDIEDSDQDDDDAI